MSQPPRMLRDRPLELGREAGWHYIPACRCPYRHEIARRYWMRGHVEGRDARMMYEDVRSAKLLGYQRDVDAP